MSKAPNIMYPIAAKTSLGGDARIFGLKRKSCATSSTSAVYIKMPADIESKTPLTTRVVWLSGLKVVLTPKPMAIASGVESA